MEGRYAIACKQKKWKVTTNVFVFFERDGDGVWGFADGLTFNQAKKMYYDALSRGKSRSDIGIDYYIRINDHEG